MYPHALLPAELFSRLGKYTLSLGKQILALFIQAKLGAVMGIYADTTNKKAVSVPLQ